MNRVVVIGGGTAGTMVANRLRRQLSPARTAITVVDPSPVHVYQPGLLYIPFGMAESSRLRRSLAAQLSAGIDVVASAVDRVDLEARSVRLSEGDPLPYDVLVVASGASLLPEETDGLIHRGAWSESVGTFYSYDGARALRALLENFSGGRLVVGIVDMPIKCPVAPLEFAFLADWYLRQRRMRDRVDITLVTPLDGAFTKPVAAKTLGGLLADKGVELVPEFNIGEVESAGKRLVGFDGREVEYDLAVLVPLHGGAPFVGRSSGLGDVLGFVPTDPATLQSKAQPNVFALGDATDLPASKAGSVAHYQSGIVVDNICRLLADEPLRPEFDGHATCFVETGFGKALLVDFNYDVEPVPGRYPTRVGLPLLRESRLNHLGKRAFEWAYWNVLLPGFDVPGVGPEMPRSGKQLGRSQRRRP